MKSEFFIADRTIMRRRFLQQTAAGMACGLCGLLQHAAAAELAAGRQGIHRVRGRALINGNPASEGMPVPPGSMVITESSSEAIYVVGQDAYLQKADTRVQIADGGAASVFRVITGALLSVFGRGTPKTIIIPLATIGIRGTGCYTQIEERRTYFCMCYGTVELTPNGGEPRSYTTQHHDSPFWIEAGSLTTAGMVSHEDTDLVLLESIVGRQPPFPVPYTR